MQCKLSLYENICFLSHIHSRAAPSPALLPATCLIAQFWEAAAYGEADSSGRDLEEQKEKPVLAAAASPVGACVLRVLQRTPK